MACGLRQLPWNIHYPSMWEDPADTEASAAMKPWAAGRAYLNWIGDEGRDRIVAGFGRDKYRRLQAIKAAWDPQNLFRHNQNITPKGETP
ncbi:MAG: BBE domain-containing protein [Acidimicrobiales bacterium]